MHLLNLLTSIVPIIAAIPAVMASPIVEATGRSHNTLERRKYFFIISKWGFCIQKSYMASLSLC